MGRHARTHTGRIGRWYDRLTFSPWFARMVHPYVVLVAPLFVPLFVPLVTTLVVAALWFGVTTPSRHQHPPAGQVAPETGEIDALAHYRA